MKDTKKDQAAGSVSVHTVVPPIIIVLSLLHILIIVTIMMINTSSSQLSKIMQDSADYMNDATGLLAGSSLMSETSIIALESSSQVNLRVTPSISLSALRMQEKS